MKKDIGDLSVKNAKNYRQTHKMDHMLFAIVILEVVFDRKAM